MHVTRTIAKVQTETHQVVLQAIVPQGAKVAVLLVAIREALDAVQTEIGTIDPETAKATIDNPIETKTHRSHESKSIDRSKRNPLPKPCSKVKNHCVLSPI